ICIEISERTKVELDHLLSVGKYRDYSEAVSVAVANQSLLHKQSGSSANEQPAPKSEGGTGATTPPQDKERPIHLPHERFTFTAPLTEREATLLITAIAWRKGCTVTTDAAGKVIGCVAHPDDVRDFLRTRGVRDFLRAGNDWPESVPSLFHLPVGNELKLAALPSDDFATGHDVPVDRW